MESDNRFGYFFLGIGLGTAVALLLAPKRGVDTRNYLRSKTQEGTDYLKTQGQEMADGAVNAVDRGKRILRDQAKTVSDAVDAGKRAYRDTVESATAGSA
jgi:gas vesicle protein